MRVVLDTNIIISRYLTPHGRVARIVDLWEGGAFEVVTSEAILQEYARVLRYPRLRKGLAGAVSSLLTFTHSGAYSVSE